MTADGGQAATGAQDATAFDAKLDEAIRRHQAGRLGEAAALYQSLLAQNGRSLVALTNFGLLLRQVGQVEAGIGLLRRALDIDPAFIGALYSLGNGLGGLRRHEDAAAAFRRVAALAPDHAYALNNLGNVQRDLRRFDAALRCYRAAAAALPDFTDARIHLGVVRQQQNNKAAAERNYRKGLALDPAKPEAHLNLGNLLLERPDPAGAAVCYARALRVRPDSAEARGNYGAALRDLDRADEAMLHQQKALALNPQDVNAYNNIGNGLNYAGRPAAAPVWYRRALRVDPGNALAHFDLGLTLLHLGEYREGWPEYEWRWAGGGPLQARGISRPQWDGRVLGETEVLLVHAEQGQGDVIQLLRYLPMVAARAKKIVLEIQPSLMSLVPDVDADVRLTPRGGPTPPFDLHVPMLSLPGVFGTELHTIPGQAPYLRADPALTARWRDRLGTAPGLRVGLIWAGSPTFKGERLRSPRLAAMSPLVETPGTRFFALQMGDGRRDLEDLTPPGDFTDLGPEIGDFRDTAAIMENLDLVISSCTGPAHLAAALGRPTWIVLPFAADWRWLTEREDSPWYPSVRLFRQDAPGDWRPVIARVKAALAARAETAPTDPAVPSHPAMINEAP
jgi:tetratricopeptide (TPR) repeat protein